MDCEDSKRDQPWDTAQIRMDSEDPKRAALGDRVQIHMDSEDKATKPLSEKAADSTAMPLISPAAMPLQPSGDAAKRFSARAAINARTTLMQKWLRV